MMEGNNIYNEEKNFSFKIVYFRDRSNQFRRQYPSGPPPPPPRYNRSPGRYDMSPPQNKRFRRDW